jgi:hypothetical protein
VGLASVAKARRPGLGSVVLARIKEGLANAWPCRARRYTLQVN